jgi:hypothetical protein
LDEVVGEEDLDGAPLFDMNEADIPNDIAEHFNFLTLIEDEEEDLDDGFAVDNIDVDETDENADSDSGDASFVASCSISRQSSTISSSSSVASCNQVRISRMSAFRQVKVKYETKTSIDPTELLRLIKSVHPQLKTMNSKNTSYFETLFTAEIDGIPDRNTLISLCESFCWVP